MEKINKLLKLSDSHQKIIIAFLIFIFAFYVRVVSLNQMGRTWDEPLYVEWGYKTIQLIKSGDFSNIFWYERPGFPPLSKYLYGTFSYLDIQGYSQEKKPIFNYDFTFTRILSAFFSSMTAVLIALFGWKYFSSLVGIVSGLIFSLLPLSVAYGQLATLESLILFFFTATFYCFINFLNKNSKKSIIATGILLGLSFSVKYTNALLVPLMLWIFLIWYFHNNKSSKLFFTKIKPLLLIFAIGFGFFILLWPMPWFHLGEVIQYNVNLRYSPYSVPEVFFGKLLLVPRVYYVVYFLLTTPCVIIFLFIIGLISMRPIKIQRKNKYANLFVSLGKIFLIISDQKKNWLKYSIVVWFVVPFIQSFYNFKQHGIRYIIEIYSPMSLIAALGFGFLIVKLGKRKLTSSILIVGLMLYLMFTLAKYSPYYLDYYNEIAGGTGMVYKTRMFQLGWWGQGVKEAVEYVKNNAKKGSIIGLAISPIDVIPDMPGFKSEQYKINKKYDYIIVNYFNVIREGFNDNEIKKEYKAVYDVKVDSAKLVTVYKR